MPAYIDDETLMQAVNALDEAGGNYSKAADALGMARTTLQGRIQTAVRRNLTGEALGGTTPPGYQLGKITQLHKTLDGKIMEWRHLLPQGEAMDALFDEFKERLNAEITAIESIPLKTVVMANLATLYPITDFHLGQYSWGKETGESYDLDIARETLLGAVKSLMSRSLATAVAVIVFMGDYFHADDETAQTRKSGNHLDVDGRNGKVTMTGAEIAVTVVDLALQKHELVYVKAIPGNHDPKSGGDLLTLALLMRYGNNPRVIIDIKPGVFWFWEWGKNMTGWHHGHTVKPEAMPGVMASYQPEMWGRTKFRYAYLGHWHRRIKGRDVQEANGAIWEVFQAITAKDAWNRSMGHASGRSIVAITLDKEDGEIQRIYENI